MNEASSVAAFAPSNGAQEGSDDTRQAANKTPPRPLPTTSDSERLMHMALEQQPLDGSVNVRTLAWVVIARMAMVTGVAHVTSRLDVTKHIAHLTLQLLEDPDVLSPTLLLMLLEFHERISEAFPERRQFFVAVRERIVPSADAPPPRPAPWHVADGERLMRTVMKYRLCEANDSVKTQRWKAIVDEFNVISP